MVVSFSQERKIDRKFPWLFVGHCADVPGVAVAAGDDDVLADAGVEYAGFVPGGGEAGDELGGFGFAVVA